MTHRELMDGITTEVACRAGAHARVTSTPTGYRVTWPGVTVHLDPGTQRATIRNAHTGKTADLPLRHVRGLIHNSNIRPRRRNAAGAHNPNAHPEKEQDMHTNKEN